jgi:hypothetical protein
VTQGLAILHPFSGVTQVNFFWVYNKLEPPGRLRKVSFKSPPPTDFANLNFQKKKLN